MDSNSAQNQSYWFVLREDQGDVILSSNCLHGTAPNPPTATSSETCYIVDSSTGRLYDECAAQADPETPWDHTTRKRDDEIKIKDQFWDPNKIKLLLTLCLGNKGAEKEMQWDEVSALVGAPPDECSTKYRHLRRTYLRLVNKKRLGKHIKWVHYPVCEEVFTAVGGVPAAALEPWDEGRVRALLAAYIQLVPQRSPSTPHHHLWKDIAARVGSTAYHCYHKFKNLKRSYFNWLARSRQTGKGIKWPYHQYFERIYHNYNPNVNAKSWDRSKIKHLLECYAETAHKFRNPKYQKKDLWKDISSKVGESPAMCDKKYRNLKQTYLRLKAKAECGRLTTKWRYYNDFELIYSNATRYIDMDGSKIVYRSDLDEDYVQLLLKFYIENKSRFRDPLTKNKTLWRMIAPRLGLTTEECDKKFRNLKQTYLRLAWKKRQTGLGSKWPYFGHFEQIFGDSSAEHCSNGAELSSPGAAAVVCRSRRELFERLAAAAEESNAVQRQRNTILQAMLQRHSLV